MRKIVMASLIAGALLAGGGVAISRPVAANSDNPHASSIVGVWEVDADAPYRPHLFSFHDDGTLSTTNPTNVQESVAAPHGGTNDSVGMGVWKLTKEYGQSFVVGTFEELNAFVDNHQATDTLSVSFKLKVNHDGNDFDGPASAKLGTDMFPSHLTGKRLKINQAAVSDL